VSGCGSGFGFTELEVEANRERDEQDEIACFDRGGVGALRDGVRYGEAGEEGQDDVPPAGR